MYLRRLATWAAAVWLASGIGGAGAAGNEVANAAQKLDNATCQTCHDGKKGKLEMLASNGEKRDVKTVGSDSYAKSVHTKMESDG